MNTTQLRTNFHHLIDNLSNNETLEELYTIAQNRIRYEKKDIIDDLSPTQLKSLDEAIKQADEGKTLPHEEVMKQMDKWLSK